MHSTTEFRRFQRRHEPRRLTYGLVFSLVLHALLLRVSFGGGPGWLPGFGFPWLDRRVEVPELRVALLPAPPPAPDPVAERVAVPVHQVRVEEEIGPALRLTKSLGLAAAPTIVPQAILVTEATSVMEAAPMTEAASVAVATTVTVPAQLPSADRPDAPLRLDAAPALIALTQTERPAWVAPIPATIPTPLVTPPEAARQRPETALADMVALEGERQELARIAAARLEAARLEATRVEAARREAARLEVEKAETARAEAARLAIAQEAAKREAVLRAIGRQLDEEAVRRGELEVARAPAAPAASVAPAAAPAGVDPEDSRREGALRAIGRELDEEAGRRKAAADARHSPSPAPMYTGPRRYRLFGRSDPNAVLARYAETWSRKIELNAMSEGVREAAKQPHTHPLVTVAVRSDGSVESVTLVVSSGVPALDEAIRRVVDSQAPFPVFPPTLAVLYDVIEIRRTWHFDVAIRLD